jgi:hypothetical protein
MKVKQGDTIVFKGYSETPEEGQAMLEEGQEYEVVEVNAEDKSVVVRIDNPDFNPKKKESEANPKTILLDVFEEEFTVPAAKGKAKAAPAKATPARGRKAAVEETEEEESTGDEDEEGEEGEEEEAPAKPAKKAAKKVVAKKAAAKSANKPGRPKKAAKAAKAAKDEEAEESSDPYADLDEEHEDQEIVELVNASDDVLALAKEVSEEASAVEYKLGGVLFHVRKSGAYKELDNRYGEKGGFSLYVLEQLNVEYRKAMYLIDIYYKWNKFGLDAEKVAQIGWAKASKIAAVMTEDTAEELLELAENNTVADLVENIKTSYKEVGGTKGEKKVLKTFKFRLFEDQAAAVEEVLQAVASSMEFKTLDQAFEHIIMEWATEHPMTPAKPAKAAVKKAAPTKARASA